MALAAGSESGGCLLALVLGALTPLASPLALVLISTGFLNTILLACRPPFFDSPVSRRLSPSGLLLRSPIIFRSVRLLGGHWTQGSTRRLASLCRRSHFPPIT